MDVEGARPLVGCGIAAVVATTALGGGPRAPGAAAAGTRVTMDDAVRLAVDRNQTLRGQRLTIDRRRRTRPPRRSSRIRTLAFGADGFTPFSPRQINVDFLHNTVTYTQLARATRFERGGKRAEAHDRGRGHHRR